MALIDLLPLRAEYHRATSIFVTVSAFPFAPIATTWSAQYPSRLRAIGSGLSGDAVLQIHGTAVSGAQIELMTVPGDDPFVGLSTTRWLTVTEVRSDTDVDGTLTLEGIEQSGQPILIDTLLASAVPCRLRQRSLLQTQIEPGTSQNELWILYAILDGVKEADEFHIDGIVYTVENVIRQFDKRLFHHDEL